MGGAQPKAHIRPHHSYDTWGNLNSQAGESGYGSCSEYTSSAAANANNQLAGLSYDASRNTSSDGSYSYTWNAESQMKTAAGVTYAYDGDGRRAAKVGSTLHWAGGPAFCVVLRSRSTTVGAPSSRSLREPALSLSKGWDTMLSAQLGPRTPPEFSFPRQGPKKSTALV